MITEEVPSAPAEVVAQLRDLRARVERVEGSVVATSDGLVIAHDLGVAETYGVEPSGLAALAAVNLSLSLRIADTASHGDLRESVVCGTLGLAATYPVGERALLAVLVRGDEPAGLHQAARATAARVADILAGSWVDEAIAWSGLPPSPHAVR